MSPNEFRKAMDEIGRLHDEINHRADLEAEAALKAGGKPVPEDPEKVRLINKTEQILSNLIEAFRAKRS